MHGRTSGWLKLLHEIIVGVEVAWQKDFSNFASFLWDQEGKVRVAWQCVWTSQISLQKKGKVRVAWQNIMTSS